MKQLGRQLESSIDWDYPVPGSVIHTDSGKQFILANPDGPVSHLEGMVLDTSNGDLIHFSQLDYPIAIYNPEDNQII